MTPVVIRTKKRAPAATMADLRELGVREEDFAIMADNAMKDVCQLTNPRKATKEQVIEIYRKAWQGDREKIVVYQPEEAEALRA